MSDLDGCVKRGATAGAAIPLQEPHTTTQGPPEPRTPQQPPMRAIQCV